jgi:hypothetical protein
MFEPGQSAEPLVHFGKFLVEKAEQAVKFTTGILIDKPGCLFLRQLRLLVGCLFPLSLLGQSVQTIG